MPNLRDTKRELSAARRAMGADDVEKNRKETPMPTKRPVVEGEPAAPRYTRKGYRAAAGCELYEATGSCGQIVVRSYKEPVTHAIDVADIAGMTPNAKKGQVHAMYASEDLAEWAASKLRAQGLTVKIVPVRPYAGQPGDADVVDRKPRKDAK